MSHTSLNKIFLLSAVLVFSIIVLTLLSFAVDADENKKSTVQNGTEGIQSINPPALPKGLSFCEEQVPLNLFWVKESLDRELLVNTYWHSSTILLIKRANRWFPVIEPILARNKIPDDFKYLALIESGFTKIESPKGAAGFWQFLEKTAREYQLEVNSHVDERYHVEKATEAACNYFHESYETYQDWTLVAASYNAGNRRITESLQKQNTNNYYELYLNEETSRYVFRILAIKSIAENYHAYGFMLEPEDLYEPIETNEVEVSKPIDDLVAFAQEHQMNYKLLKELNPWLVASNLPNSSGKTYMIKVLAEK